MGSEVATAAYGGLVAIPAVWGIGKVRVDRERSPVPLLFLRLASID
jgi:hypothetical protein